MESLLGIRRFSQNKAHLGPSNPGPGGRAHPPAQSLAHFTQQGAEAAPSPGVRVEGPTRGVRRSWGTFPSCAPLLFPRGGGRKKGQRPGASVWGAVQCPPEGATVLAPQRVCDVGLPSSWAPPPALGKLSPPVPEAFPPLGGCSVYQWGEARSCYPGRPGHCVARLPGPGGGGGSSSGSLGLRTQCWRPSFQPVAAGSGIPQIKCFLNGVKIPHVVRLKVRHEAAPPGAQGLAQGASLLGEKCVICPPPPPKLAQTRAVCC